MHALLADIYRICCPIVYCAPGDMDWWRYSGKDLETMRAVQLWFAGEEIAGFCWPQTNGMDIMLHPHQQSLLPALIEWSEQRQRTLAPEGAVFTLWCFEDDAARAALLASLGYAKEEDHYRFHRLELSRPLPPTVPLPAGYTIRHVRGDEDVAARVEVHRAAFAPSRMTVEKHRAVVQARCYVPELDLVAVAPDGSFAAFALAWYDGINRAGEFEPVGCHPDHQRRGLASAVIIEGLHRLRARGADSATVFGYGDSPGSRLYAHLGFAVAGRCHAWRRSLAQESASSASPSPNGPTGAIP